MLIGDQTTPVTWQLANEPQAVRRLVRKLEREAPGPVRVVLRSRAVRLRAAAADDDGAGGVSGDCAGADSAQAGRADQDESPRCAQAGGAAPRRAC